MARIRTIKPEFFTSEDIVAMSPMARLLYIALWCESDKEGRMAWKPKTFKMRYLPADTCNIDKLCQELIGAGLVVLYGDGLAFIPKFAKHQHVNPRESASTLPIPEQNDACARVSTREHLDLHGEHLDLHAQVGREGKGREGDCTEPPRDSAPAATIPLVDGTEHPVSQEQVDEWQESYPAVDVLQQLREMRTWSNANKSQRKTARGVDSFIVRWLGKEQDKGGRGKQFSVGQEVFV